MQRKKTFAIEQVQNPVSVADPLNDRPPLSRTSGRDSPGAPCRPWKIWPRANRHGLAAHVDVSQCSVNGCIRPNKLELGVDAVSIEYEGCLADDCRIAERGDCGD